MSLKLSYSVLAHIYDPLVARASEPMRKHSLERLGNVLGQRVLLAGVGTGLDIPHLPSGGKYTGLDVTPAMLRYAQRRIQHHQDIRLQQGDVMALPFEDNHFDVVVMHLILAVVPEPVQALREAARVLKPGGRVLVLDKFLRPDQRAPLRRLLNTVLRHVATRTDVVFEHLLPAAPSLRVLQDEPAIPGGWFRYIELHKHL
ncbi:MAG: methyltransferase domain-containing protein [Proteobacteria bacterium]|nr:methyltransferase domain-containing protein [Pseudomonadota bacterium]